MFRRLRWMTIGYVGGLATAWWATRRVRRTVDRLAPPQVRARASEQLRTKGSDVRAAVSEGRDAMREREQELREAWDPRRPAGRGGRARGEPTAVTAGQLR